MTPIRLSRRLLPVLPTLLPAMLIALAAANAQESAADSAKAAEVKAAEEYADCMYLARSDPDAAIESARTWQDQGGGDPARHCEAVALLNAGDYAAAGRKLEDLARTMEQGTDVALRADALAQAGQAWLLADDLPRAEATIDQALELRPEDVELWIDRALIRFQMGRYWPAIDDLNRASELAPERPEIYAFRASAYRYAEAPRMAREDANRALDLDPDDPEALLERGILRRLAGDEAGARQDWLKLLEVAPGSPAAETARRNLERMDVATSADGTEPALEAGTAGEETQLQ